MNATLTPELMYDALVRKDSQFEGVFFAAVKTTGIFCRPTCTARKPKFENVAFYTTSKEAILHGYRPCKVCSPLEQQHEAPAYIRQLLTALQEQPDRKIRDQELREMGMEPVQVRRWFKKHHNLTFQSFQRMQRINQAFGMIRYGEKVTSAAYENGYDSLSGFHYSFKKSTGFAPNASKSGQVITITRLTTPLGPMLTGATDKGICLLEFTDRKMLETELKQLQKLLASPLLPGQHRHFDQLHQELQEYFEGRRQLFTVPLDAPGTLFQQSVWKELTSIPYGTTRSYKQQAMHLNNPSAVRAVANANGLNRISLLIPCHRVIGSDGSLTGYGGGIWRKQWLLDHEERHQGSEA